MGERWYGPPPESSKCIEIAGVISAPPAGLDCLRKGSLERIAMTPSVFPLSFIFEKIARCETKATIQKETRWRTVGTVLHLERF